MKLVFGLGKSGLAALKFLADQGEKVEFADDCPQTEQLAAAQALGFQRVFEFFPKYQEVIAAPGVSLNHPWLEQAKAAGIPVSGEAELAYRYDPRPVVAITGTAGKTSTTIFTTHLLNKAGLAVKAGGNLGIPYLELIQDPAPVGFVLELSSFQLERVHRFKPQVAVLLNLGVDHLDRHGSLENYHQAKLRILQNLSDQEALVYNQSDPKIVTAAQNSRAQKFPFTPTSDPRSTNAQAALQAARAFLAWQGLPDPGLAEELANLPSVIGRFEVIGEKDGIRYIDDSIATRTLAVQAALAGAPAPVAWILGGVDKGAELEVLRPLVAEKVRIILAIGQDGPAMAAAFQDLCEVISISASRGEDALRIAVQTAQSRLSHGSVLLAPLATSFDQFSDYRERSRVYRRVVEAAL